MPKANKPKSRPKTNKTKSATNAVSRSKSKPASLPNRYPDQDDDLRKELEGVLAGFVDPEVWLNTPNPYFYLKKPIDMIGTEDEDEIRQWIGAVKYGLFS